MCGWGEVRGSNILRSVAVIMQRAASIASSPAASCKRVAHQHVFGRSIVLPYHSVRCCVTKSGDAQEQGRSMQQQRSQQLESSLGSALLVATPLLLDVQSVFAADGELGLLEGRTAALVHPAIMFFLFASSCYAGYLGYQWRRTREIGDQIRELRKTAPAPAATAEGAPAVESAVTMEIQAKEKERKDLLAGNFKDKHAWWGSLLLATGTGIAIEGAANTFIRTGKLFPGPHLYAGALMVSLWALAAALTPEMQKGNDTARSAHIALNTVNVLLFASQIPTGLEIVGKVFQFTQWP